MFLVHWPFANTRVKGIVSRFPLLRPEDPVLGEQDLVNRYNSRTTPWKRAFEKNQILFGANIDDFQISYRLGLHAVLSGHPLSLDDLRRPGAATDGTGRPFAMGAVGHPPAVEAMPLHDPRETPSLALAGYVDFFADCENFRTDRLTQGVVVRIVHSYFFECFEAGVAGFF